MYIEEMGRRREIRSYHEKYPHCRIQHHAFPMAAIFPLKGVNDEVPSFEQEKGGVSSFFNRMPSIFEFAPN